MRLGGSLFKEILIIGATVIVSFIVGLWLLMRIVG